MGVLLTITQIYTHTRAQQEFIFANLLSVYIHFHKNMLKFKAEIERQKQSHSIALTANKCWQKWLLCPTVKYPVEVKCK